MVSDISQYRGIRVSKEDERTRILEEVLQGDDPSGLVADLADGYYVVTANMYANLKRLGIDFEDVELVDGVPKHVRDWVKEEYAKNGVYPPF